MEALATLSLVCNITQLVEEGLSLAKLYKQVRKAGSSSENIRLQELMKLVAAVDKAYISLNSPQPLNLIDSEIKDIAVESTKASRELNSCLLGLAYKDAAGSLPRSPAATFLRTLRRQSDISELYKHYEKLQMVLRTSLLRSVHHLLLQIRDEHTEEFIKIGATNNAIRSLLEGKPRTAAAASGVIEKSIQQLEKKMESLVLEEQRKAARARLARLLERLDFDGRLGRLDQIEARVGQNHETPSWIFVDPDKTTIVEDSRARSHTPVDEFEDDDDQVYGTVSKDTCQATGNHFQRPQRNQARIHFVEWLRNGSGIFHLSGKPGSGKSSLMAYIYHDLLVNGLGHKHLSHWMPDRPLITLSFFFFSPSPNNLLKTSQGLWRSVLFQVLKADPKIAEVARADTLAPRGLQKILQDTEIQETPWRTYELFEWLLYLVTRSSSKFIVLLDGLDELDEYNEGDRGHSRLLDCLESITAKCSNLKVLCASRPDQPFKSRLSKYPSLMLQEVNYYDIRSFCKRELANTRAASFVNEMAYRAEGVFLWAWLVAKDLAKAAARNATTDELHERFEACPPSMTKLYEHMLERQDYIFKKQPRPFLRLLEFVHAHDEALTAFELLLSTIPQPALASAVTGVFPSALKTRLNKQAAGFEEEVILRCAGLIEIQRNDYFAQRQVFSVPKASNQRLRSLLALEVNFVHRSALDFLHEEGRKFLEQVHISDRDATRILGLAHIGYLCLDDTDLSMVPQEPSPFYSCGYEAPWYAALCAGADQRDIYRCFEDRLRDNLLARNMFSQDEEAFQFWGLRFWHSQLPSSINLAVALSFRYGTCFFDNYTVPLIQRLDPQERALVAVYALCHGWSLSARPVTTRMGDLLSLTSPTTSVRWDFQETTACSLWEHFASWGWWSLGERAQSSQPSIELTQRFVEQGADLYADFVTTFSVTSGPGWVFHQTRTEITLPSRKGENYEFFLIRGKCRSLLADLTSLQGISEWADSVAMSWFPNGLKRSIDLHPAIDDLADVVRYLSSPTENQSRSILPADRAWCAIAIASLNENLPLFSQDELDALQGRGYGFHEGVFCHHWRAKSCMTCGYGEG